MKRILSIALLFLPGFSMQLHAQGDLLVAPTRVVFDGNKQKEELSLVNIGAETTTYSVSFVQRRMQEDGSNVTIETPDSGQMFADPYLRVFPRKVTLAPGEPQIIMLQCRRAPDMKDGEYRSHLYFRSEKDYKPLGMDDSVKDSTLLNVQVIPIFGISIPVIIRSGEVHVSTELRDIKLDVMQDTMAFLKLTIHRKGNISVYGNLVVDYYPVQGKPYQVGLVKGVGVYTTINKRYMSIKLAKTPGLTYRSGKLKVRYTSPDEARYEVFSEEEVALSN